LLACLQAAKKAKKKLQEKKSKLLNVSRSNIEKKKIGPITFIVEKLPPTLISFKFKPQLYSITSIFSIFITQTPLFFQFLSI